MIQQRLTLSLLSLKGHVKDALKKTNIIPLIIDTLSVEG